MYIIAHNLFQGYFIIPLYLAWHNWHCFLLSLLPGDFQFLKDMFSFLMSFFPVPFKKDGFSEFSKITSEWQYT